MKAIIIIFSLFLSVQVLAQEATELMRQIHVQYNQRFDANGKFINDANLSAQFSANQKSVIQKLKNAGYVKNSIKIYNNVMSNMVISVFIVQEKSGQFAGLLIERSNYDNPGSDSVLRLYSLPILIGGMDVFTLDGGTIINLKSVNLKTDTAGVFSVKYPTNFNSNTFSEAQFNILKTTTGDFGFFNMSEVGFTQMKLDIWYSLFPQNFGIKSVLLK